MKDLAATQLLLVVTLLVVPALARAEATAADDSKSGLLALLAAEVNQPPPASPEVESEWTKPIPLSFSIDYTLITDYIFRGVNFSEYAREGREELNHQLSVGTELDMGEWGNLGMSIWFEWYAGQERLTTTDSNNLQEVDYTVYYSRDIETLHMTIETGWIGYHFPRLNGDADFTHEWYVTLSFDDGPLWRAFGVGTEGPVLNPYVSYYLDLDDFRGSWLEFGISHDFSLAEICGGAPILRNITVTPSLVLGMDHRWLNPALGVGSPSTRLANLTYGLDVAYDLGAAVNLPAEYGSLTLTGSLYFSQAFRDEIINDEFWGGATLGYSW